MNFGEYLIKNKIITSRELTDALNAQKYINKKIGRILVELGYIEQDSLNIYLTRFFKAVKSENIDKGFIYEKINSLDLNEELLKTLLDLNFIPLDLKDDKLALLVTEVNDQKIELLEKSFPYIVYFKVISDELFNYAKIIRKNKALQEVQKNELSSKANKNEIDGPYNKIYKELIEKAKKEKISDIHIIPYKDGLRIKLRKFGTLTLWKELSIDHRDSFIAHCKHLLNLNVAIIGVPQDSRASVDHLSLDLRINSTPMIYGNKIVIRLLDREKEFNIDKSGIESNIINELKEVCNKKSGLILISGQTGSGKTTTLYSLLSYLNQGNTNISTIEDPVEYTLDGLDQIDITSKKNLTFSNSLKALLRQDPDVILVGEVRDEETANLCLKASSSGHLVFTTIHAANPEGAVKKFVDFGVDSNSIAENLLVSMNQCLVPIVCRECSKIVTMKKDFKELYNLGIKKYRYRNTKGCSHCFEGHSSMLPINEFLKPSCIQKYLSGGPISFKTKKEIALDLLSKELITPESYYQF